MRETKEATPQQYLEMWLSEQIPPQDWMEILNERPDIREIYKNHMMENKNGKERNK